MPRQRLQPPAAKPSQMATRRGSGPASENQHAGARKPALRGCQMAFDCNGRSYAVPPEAAGMAETLYLTATMSTSSP